MARPGGWVHFIKKAKKCETFFYCKSGIIIECKKAQSHSTDHDTPAALMNTTTRPETNLTDRKPT